jgi:hypothetical protein
MSGGRPRPTIDTSANTTKERTMYQNPELMLTLAHDHQRDLIAAADRKRLFSRISRARKAQAGNHARSTRGPSH